MARLTVLGLLCAFALAATTRTVSARRTVKDFTINLDLPPKQRYTEIISNSDFNATAWGFYNEFFKNDKGLTDALYNIVDRRGPEVDELQQEVEGLAAASNLPLKFVRTVQMLYELQTLMVPIVNLTGPDGGPVYDIPKGYEALARIPWRGPGCTGIIAQDSSAGNCVYHARDLDFSPVKYMTHLVYTGIFTKGGKEVFRTQMVAGYCLAITGIILGPNGFTIERNTRYPDREGGNDEMFHNLMEKKRPLNGWTLRKILETAADYEAATAAIAATPYVSTEYAIVSGVKKGVIYSKDPDRVAHVQTLGQANYDERSDYIIITNFDFFFHDIREWFDPTGGEVGHPRRIAAQKILNSTAVLTPQVLFNTINAKGVIADTIFQAIMSVEKGLWNVSQPDL